MNERFRVKTKEMKPNKIYGGVLVGETQMSANGEYYWRRAGGEIQKINPHPDSLWIEVGSVEEKGFLKPKLSIVL